MPNNNPYVSLLDEDTDTTTHYHPMYLNNYAACPICGSPTREACVGCKKPHCHLCLFNIHLRENHEEDPEMIEGEFGLERAEPDYEYTRICLACYTDHEKHPPLSWGWLNHRFVAYAAYQGATAIRQGVGIPAGDLDAWVSGPGAVKVVRFHYQDDALGKTWPGDLDAFAYLSLFAWMSAWQSEVKRFAEQASKILTNYENKGLETAREADRGYIDYSQFE